MNGPLAFAIVLVATPVAAKDPFPPKTHVPDAKHCRDAIGPVSALSEPLRRAYDPAGHEPVPPPMPGDWLFEHRELGQSFESFVKQRHRRPDAARRVIALQPLGQLPAGRSPAGETLRAFLEAYFGLPARLLDPVALDPKRDQARVNKVTGNVQFRTTPLLNVLERRRPRDAFCAVGVTLEDLYPSGAWNFVFGEARRAGGVAVNGLARYDPSFFGGRPSPGDAERVLRRSLRVLAHETGHLFGLSHCVHFRCVMNGMNSLDENDALPLHLCPVCLRKLQHAIGFDVAGRYRALERFLRAAGLAVEAEWISARLRSIEGP